MNHWCHLLDVPASFTVKEHVNKARLVSCRPYYPSGRCPLAYAIWDAFSLVGWLNSCSVLSKQWYSIVGTIGGFSFRWRWLPGQPENWKFLVFQIRWWIMARWKGHGLNMSLDGSYTHHNRLVIPRLSQDLCILLFIECHLMLAISIGNAYWQLCESVCGRNGCIFLDCKALSSNCDVYNYSKPIWQGPLSLYPLVLMTALRK